MEEFTAITQLISTGGITAVLLFWVMQERRERMEDKERFRIREQQLINTILRLAGRGSPEDTQQ